MTDRECVEFLQWALPQLRLRWPGFRKVRGQVHKRLNRRLGELGLEKIEDYRAYLHSHAAEWLILDGLCRISISRFYRDHSVFHELGTSVLPKLASRSAAEASCQLRIWSAGCASGEEPYTVAILWQQQLKAAFSSIELRLIATDADPQLLQRARLGRYPASSLKDLPRDWLDLLFQPLDHDYQLRADLLPPIEFSQQEIRQQAPPGPFDLVLCRNLVFTYFEESLQQQVLEWISQRMTPGSVLVIGKHESLPTGTRSLKVTDPKLGLYEKPHLT